MNRKIPTKPFTTGTDKKVSPERAKRNEPNAASIAGKKPAVNQGEQPTVTKTIIKRKGSGPSLLILILLVALLGAYIGYTLGPQYLDNTGTNRVAFNQTEYSYEVGDAGRLPVLVSGEFDSYDVFWISSNAEIVAVDQGGNIIALAPGQVVITAAVGNGSIKDTVIINVEEPAE